MFSESLTRFRFCDPMRTLQDLHGDWLGLHALATAFLGDMDTHLIAVVTDDPAAGDAAHRLRTAFGIFHAERGARLSREVESSCRAGRIPSRPVRLALLTETVGMGEELRLLLAQPQAPMATAYDHA